MTEGTKSKDYKQTLNLPFTNFPMRGNLPNNEPKTLAWWQSIDLYKNIRSQNVNNEKFVFNDGPPYANGDIHIGHAANKILKDIVVKSQVLSGKNAAIVPGWDCHGLPIELQVEKKLGKSKQDLSPKEFRSACREFAKTQIDIQRESFKRLGVIADWDNPYITMDYQYEADTIRALAKIYQNGHIARGSKPVHWCVNCGSALAEAEVEYQDKTSNSIDIAFELIDSAKLTNELKIGKLANICAVIWTTTPWTLPANEAVAVHPELTYVILKADFTNASKVGAIILAKDLIDECVTRYDLENYQVLAEINGKQLENLKLKHPFYNKQVPIILGDHVTTDSGTGLVHTAPAHGLEDYIVAKKYDLPVTNPVDNHGHYFQDLEFFGGENAFKSNQRIIDLIAENGLLLHSTKLTHSYPHCWRHKTPIMFRATQQWFISMNQAGLLENAQSQAKQVTWIPEWGSARFQSMLESRPDWCISRQRSWGVPLCLVTHNQTGELHPQTSKIMEHVANLVEKSGIDAWFDLELTDLPFEDLANYEKTKDILDVWFDSGVNHDCVLAKHKDLAYPADLYLEGSDQHRGWFQSSMLTAVAINNTAPYKQVLTHGYTVDAKGRKMSKSLGNVVAPSKVIKASGAEIIRLWVSAIDYKGELHISDEILKRVQDSYRRIRNTARFLLANLNGFDAANNLLAKDKMLELDKWIVLKTQNLQTAVIEHYQNYEFHSVYQKIHNFCINELGSFYLDIIKDRQYTLPKNSLARHSCQTAMYYIINSLVRLISPILSFTSEEIFKYLQQDILKISEENITSVFLEKWYANLPDLTLNHFMDLEFWELISNVRTQVNKSLETARNSGTIGSGLEAECELLVTQDLFDKLNLLEDELRFVLITSTAQIKLISKADLASNQEYKTDLEGLFVKVHKSDNSKCTRCWHHREDVNTDPEYPDICGRCVTNLATKAGEVRKYA